MEKINDFLTRREAADFLGVNPNTLINWGKSKKLIAYRNPINNWRLYKKEDLEAILNNIQRSKKD